MELLFQQAFLTTQNHQDPILHKRVQKQKYIQLKSRILQLTTSMPSHQICHQAAINLGLPLSLANFTNLSKYLAAQNCFSNINSTFHQLKNLSRQAKKLKNSSFPTNNKKESKGDRFIFSQKIQLDSKIQRRNDSEVRLMKQLQKEINNRRKVQKFYSMDKIDRIKGEEIKKKSQKAKFWNKKAQKVFQSFKEKQQKTYDNYQHIQYLKKPETKYSFKRKYNNTKKETEQFKQTIEQSLQMSQEKQRQHHFFERSEKRGKTVQGKRNMITRENISTSLQKRRKFVCEDHENKMNRNREKKVEMQQEKQKNVIQKVIKKNKKMMEIQQLHNARSEKIEKQILKQVRQQKQIFAEKDQNKLQNKIIEQCNQHIKKKQIRMRQKVNKVRNDLKAKEERLQKHRNQQERYRFEKQNSDQSNQSFYRKYDCFLAHSSLKQNKQEAKILTRHHNVVNKQQEQQQFIKLSRIPTMQLEKKLEKLRNNQLLKSMLCFH